MMKKFLYLLVLCLAFGEVAGQGQNFLIVSNPDKKKRYEYHIGDAIILKQVDDFPTLRGTIYAISDSAIYLGPQDSILYRYIASVVIREDTRLLNKNLWLTNLVSTTGAIALWQLVYLINAGELSPDVGAAPYIIGFTTVPPILVNRIAAIFRRRECPMENGWAIHAITFPQQP